MIDPAEFVKTLVRAGISFYSGVPDSLLASLINAIGAIMPPSNHIIAANEGSAVALACGYHLATGKLGVVYMQNSGLGNAINPLTSIADPDVYGIPMLLIVGWRGEPGVKDEPQHVKQGAISEDLLRSLKIPFYVMDSKTTGADINAALSEITHHEGPSAFLVRKDCFADSNVSASLPTAPGESKNMNFVTEIESPASVVHASSTPGVPAPGVPIVSNPEVKNESIAPQSTSVPVVNAAPPLAFTSGLAPLMSREDSIRFIQTIAPKDAILVATTGKISRELYEIRLGSGLADRDFYCVGGMGHASQIALGIALSQNSLVICLDGDGAALMHLGHLATIAEIAPTNFMHIILNNQMHESVGGQPTSSPQTNFAELGRALGYPATCRCRSLADLVGFFATMNIASTPMLIEMLVAGGSRPDLSRPKESPKDRKIKFMKAIGVSI